ncbi:MAG: type I-MYXAN CRISPR-associated protein Cas6/Cmx6 [Thiohalocapsa sp.]|jgi:CRISPR-associated protein Cas6|uniref:type I-MYXAN CRISPR-associated protein Cas6/Cmx6 n=1 Tax=Thiohalocapsa sp. TaxID=2497641 RepID=UPI0025D3CBE6|nr:type I-MYXAN CRISPR-associated protein Cas6/Cmx6 [Thiohalocapsa sp.]
MFWQDEEETPELTVADDVVDVLFTLQCRSIPVDHAYVLSQALLEAVPWLAQTGGGIHTIHVAGSQNGWERPSHSVDEHLLLSRRTKLSIRVPEERLADLKHALEGRTVDVGGAALTIGAGKPRSLAKERTLFARYVAGPAERDETAFLRWAADTLARQVDVRVRKALCGKETPLTTPDGPVSTRSLMLADLKPEESLRLQQQGLGPHRLMGCGIFIPHKGIDAVHKPQ